MKPLKVLVISLLIGLVLSAGSLLIKKTVTDTCPMNNDPNVGISYCQAYGPEKRAVYGWPYGLTTRSSNSSGDDTDMPQQNLQAFLKNLSIYTVVSAAGVVGVGLVRKKS